MEPIKAFAVLDKEGKIIVSGNAQYAIVGNQENGQLFAEEAKVAPVTIVFDEALEA